MKFKDASEMPEIERDYVTISPTPIGKREQTIVDLLNRILDDPVKREWFWTIWLSMIIIMWCLSFTVLLIAITT